MYCNLKDNRHRAINPGLFWPNLNCACAETAISELPVKILTSLDRLTSISKKGLIWGSDDVFRWVIKAKNEWCNVGRPQVAMRHNYCRLF